MSVVWSGFSVDQNSNPCCSVLLIKNTNKAIIDVRIPVNGFEDELLFFTLCAVGDL